MASVACLVWRPSDRTAGIRPDPARPRIHACPARDEAVRARVACGDSAEPALQPAVQRTCHGQAPQRNPTMSARTESLGRVAYLGLCFVSIAFLSFVAG